MCLDWYFQYWSRWSYHGECFFCTTFFENTIALLIGIGEIKGLVTEATFPLVAQFLLAKGGDASSLLKLASSKVLGWFGLCFGLFFSLLYSGFLPPLLFSHVELKQLGVEDWWFTGCVSLTLPLLSISLSFQFAWVEPNARLITCSPTNACSMF